MVLIIEEGMSLNYRLGEGANNRRGHVVLIIEEGTWC